MKNQSENIYNELLYLEKRIHYYNVLTQTYRIALNKGWSSPKLEKRKIVAKLRATEKQLMQLRIRAHDTHARWVKYDNSRFIKETRKNSKSYNEGLYYFKECSR